MFVQFVSLVKWAKGVLVHLQKAKKKSYPVLERCEGDPEHFAQEMKPLCA